MAPINAVFIQGTVDHVAETAGRLEILLSYADPQSRRWGYFFIDAPLRWRTAIHEGDAVLFRGALQSEGSSDTIRAETFLRLAQDPPAGSLASKHSPVELSPASTIADGLGL